MRRTRVLASTTLALTLALSPGAGSVVVQASETPEEAVHALMDAATSIEFGGLIDGQEAFIAGVRDQFAPLSCEEFQDAAVTSLAESMEDLTGAYAGALPEDVQAILEGLRFSLDDRTLTTLSEEGDAATVEVTATMNVSMADDTLRVLVRLGLEQMGQPSDDAEVEALLPQLRAQVEAQGETDSDSVSVVRENGRWVVCDADFLISDDDDSEDAEG